MSESHIAKLTHGQDCAQSSCDSFISVMTATKLRMCHTLTYHFHPVCTSVILSVPYVESDTRIWLQILLPSAGSFGGDRVWVNVSRYPRWTVFLGVSDTLPPQECQCQNVKPLPHPNAPRWHTLTTPVRQRTTKTKKRGRPPWPTPSNCLRLAAPQKHMRKDMRFPSERFCGAHRCVLLQCTVSCMVVTNNVPRWICVPAIEWRCHTSWYSVDGSTEKWRLTQIPTNQCVPKLTISPHLETDIRHNIFVQWVLSQLNIRKLHYTFSRMHYESCDWTLSLVEKHHRLATTAAERSSSYTSAASLVINFIVTHDANKKTHGKSHCAQKRADRLLDNTSVHPHWGRTD